MRFLCTFSMFLATFTCQSQMPKTSILKLTDLSFESHAHAYVGHEVKNPEHLFSLLGSGYLIAPRSNNYETLIHSWLKNHPDAFVIPVSSFAMDEKRPNHTMTYCILVDKNDTVNNFLISSGCFPKGVMGRPHTWQEMSSREKVRYTNPILINIHMDSNSYTKY